MLAILFHAETGIFISSVSFISDLLLKGLTQAKELESCVGKVYKTSVRSNLTLSFLKALQV